MGLHQPGEYVNEIEERERERAIGREKESKKTLENQDVVREKKGQ